MTDIYIVNQSTLLDSTSIDAMLPALQEQVSRDFAPLWGIEATLHSGSGPGWIIRLLDNCGIADDLGFHIDENNVPTAKVGVGDAQRYGVPISSVVSHELLEMLADPTTTRMTGNYIVEVCDPVSGDYYDIGGITVANFCTPRYFGYTQYGRFDQLGLLQSGIPQIRPGGMIMYWSGTTWASTFGRHVDGGLPWRAHYQGRSHFRAQNPFTPLTA